MKTRIPPRSIPLLLALAIIEILSACAPLSTPTLFVPPTEDVGAQHAAPSTVAPTSAATVVPTIIVPTPTPPCTDGLTYVTDLTVPDGTTVAPGQSVDKQWLVTNSGTCSWDARYRLKLTGGDAMGASTEQALYPARAGTQATLRIVFTAPQAAGSYQSAWQAVAPDGTAFGDTVYVQVLVQ